MSTSRFFLPLILIVSILLTSCEKDPYKNGEPSLPPITMEGKNTLGFLLDGKVWVPYQESPGLFTPTIEANLDYDYFIFTGRLKRKSSQIDQMINIRFTINDVGVYQIPPPPSSGKVFTDFNFRDYGCNSFKCTPENSEINIINFDRGRRIISGTFFFKDVANPCGDTIQITDGRFDVKY